MDGSLAYRDEFQREELIGGRIVAMAPAVMNHNFISGNIYSLFSHYLKGKKCTPFNDNNLVYLTETDRFVPDMMVVCDPEKLRWDGVHGAPDLVVEVLSPSTAKNDRGRKMKVYEQCGVREYWIVNPGEKSLEQYVLENGAFQLREVYTLFPAHVLDSMDAAERAAVKTEFSCSLFDDLRIRLEDVFDRVV